MVVNHQLYKKDIFFPDWSPSPFLVLIVEFFFENLKKTVFLHNVMNLIFLPSLLFFGSVNFAMMVPR